LNSASAAWSMRSRVSAAGAEGVRRMAMRGLGISQELAEGSICT
jgi:hypothetical protein